MLLDSYDDYVRIRQSGEDALMNCIALRGVACSAIVRGLMYY